MKVILNVIFVYINIYNYLKIYANEAGIYFHTKGTESTISRDSAFKYSRAIPLKILTDQKCG